MRLCVIVTVCLLDLSLATRDRTCCKYSCGQEGDQCPAWCDSSSGCVLRDRSGLLGADRSSGQCSVSHDSKKNKTDDSISQCLSRQYTSDHRLVEQYSADNILPFSVVAYPFKSTHQLDSPFTGKTSDWSTISMLSSYWSICNILTKLLLVKNILT